MKNSADEGKKKKKKKKALQMKSENTVQKRAVDASTYSDTKDAHPEWFRVRPVKEAISIRIDKDVLETYRSLGKGYQSAMNNALRTYIQEHPSEFRSN